MIEINMICTLATKDRYSQHLKKSIYGPFSNSLLYVATHNYILYTTRISLICFFVAFTTQYTVKLSFFA